MKNEFTKKYQIWFRSDGNTWYFYEFDTLKECLECERYGDYYITQSVGYDITPTSERIEK